MVKRFSLSFVLFLFASDLALVAAALMLATQARAVIPLGEQGPISNWILPLPVYGLSVGLWAVTFPALNVYNPTRTVRLVSELQTITVATVFAFLMLTGALYLSFRSVSRLQILYSGTLCLGLIFLHRIVVRGFFKLTGGSSYDRRRVLVVGTGYRARAVGRMVQAHAWAGLYLVGFAGDEPKNGNRERDAPVLGPLGQTLSLVGQHHADEVVIALPPQAQQNVVKLIHDLQALPINLRIVPDYFDEAFLQLTVENFGGMPLLCLK